MQFLRASLSLRYHLSKRILGYFFIHVFQALKVTCIPNWQWIFYGVLKTAFNMNALNTDRFIYFWYYLHRMFSISFDASILKLTNLNSLVLQQLIVLSFDPDFWYLISFIAAVRPLVQPMRSAPARSLIEQRGTVHLN